MTDDLVKDLRNSGWYLAKPAADRIEHLEDRCANLLVENGILNNRIEKLEAALRTIYECCDETGNCSVVRRIARKALEGKDER